MMNGCATAREKAPGFYQTTAVNYFLNLTFLILFGLGWFFFFFPDPKLPCLH